MIRKAKIEIIKEETSKDFTLIIDGVTMSVTPNFARIIRDIREHEAKSR